tara:strand:- start:3963 stop:5291 length:1329 start_codon:yes stop_codon:yes gene_type:complete
MKIDMKLFLISLIISSALLAQEKEEIPIEEIRDNKIKSLLEIVKENRDIYVSEDKVRLDKFVKLVSEREKLLQEAKNQLAAEQRRNKRLEETFETNEKTLAELEDSLQIKVGVLGELFGVTRQFAGELLASSENDVSFYEFTERPEILRRVGAKKIHNLQDFESLWLSYFDQMVAGSEIKTFKSSITLPNGENTSGEVTRYGLFNAVYNNKYLEPEQSLNSFQLLTNQPESKITRSLRRHAKASDYRTVSIDPTRGFLLSLYLDKPGWFERIAQGKSIGFIIVLIGLSGLIFASYKLYLLSIYTKEIADENNSESIIYRMNSVSSKDLSPESKENVMDELIINYSSKVDWGNNWIKFFAAVAPLLGLLGTVIGMIETFQAITLFGTGDPKQMAGGISQALVTTMLGLIVAAPLLGFYTYLSEKSSSIVQFLEEKASYILSRS